MLYFKYFTTVSVFQKSFKKKFPYVTHCILAYSSLKAGERSTSHHEALTAINHATGT